MSVTKVRVAGNAIEPAPLISIARAINRLPTGEIISAPFTIRLVGDLLAFRGSPNSSGNFYGGSNHAPIESISADGRLAAISTKLEALYNLFDTDYQELSWTSADGSKTVSCYPRIVSIDTPEGLWYNNASYTVTLEADSLSGVPELNDLANSLQSASESWDFAPEGNKFSYGVRHSVSAVGREGNEITPFDEAYNWVTGRLGFDLTKVGANSSGDLNFSTYTAFNHSREEVRDEPSASYSVTETWSLAPQDYQDIYTTSLQISAESDTTRSVSVQGTIQGYYEGLNNYSDAYGAALAAWNTIQGQLLGRASGLANTTAIRFKNGSVDHNSTDGVISYNYQYDNSPLTSGVIDDYTVSRAYDSSNYLTTVTLEGSIQGQIEDENESYTDKYNKALAWWTYNVYPSIFTRASDYAPGVSLKTTPRNRRVSDNPYQGNISYVYEWDDRLHDTYEEDFTVSSSYSRDQGVTAVTVNGSVRGLAGSGNNVFERYMNASGALPDDAEVYARAQTYYQGTFSSTIIGKEISHSPYAGQITYNYQYNDEPAPLFADALSELVTVSDNNAASIIPIFPIVGGAPILQQINSTTEKRRQIAIELVFGPPTGTASYINYYNQKPDTSSIVSALMPTGTAYKVIDQENWTLNTRRYSRNVEYVWE